MKDDTVSASNPSDRGSSRRGRIFYGWWILLLGACINTVGAGVTYHSLSVFFLPLKREFGVSSAAISLLYGAARLEGGLEGPLVGYLIDRFGSRKLILIGATCAGLGLIFLATVDSFISFLLGYVFVVALGSNAGFFHPVSAAVNKWFIRHRGLGFSVITASGSVGGMIMAPILSFIILNYGWRRGIAFAGLAILMVALPAALPFKRSPEDMGLHPDGREPSKGEAKALHSVSGAEIHRNYTVPEALRTVHFWVLMTAITLRILVTVALNTHFVPLLVWGGASEAGGAYLLGLYAFMTIPLSLAAGWTGDRWNRLRLCSLCTMPMIVSMVGMILWQGTTILYFFPMAFACIMATAPLNWALIGDFFGRTSYATLRGIMGVFYGVATFASPIYAGWIFDLTGSYDLVLLTFSIVLSVTALIFGVLPLPSHRQPKTGSANDLKTS